jgi:hypothetical protein
MVDYQVIDLNLDNQEAIEQIASLLLQEFQEQRIGELEMSQILKCG